jgi:hypothetical protein
MVNRIKWIILLIILYILLKIVDVENWFNRLTIRKVILCLATWFRIFLVADFVFSCYTNQHSFTLTVFILLLWLLCFYILVCIFKN